MVEIKNIQITFGITHFTIEINLGTTFEDFEKIKKNEHNDQSR